MMDQSEKKKLMVLFGIFGVTFLVVYFNLLLRPQFSGFIKNNREYIALKRRVRETERIIASKKQKEMQLANLEKYSDSLEKSLPTDDETSGLLEDFSQIAHASGVEITKIQPIENKNKMMPGLKKDKQEKTLPYTDYPILIESVAGYHQAVDFIKNLENLGTFLEIEGITITQRSEDYRRHKVEINLKTYIMKD